MHDSEAKNKRSDKYKTISARIKEGATLEVIKKVFTLKTSQWKNDKDMSQYLRISTLMNRKNFEKYQDELLAEPSNEKEKNNSETPSYMMGLK